MEAVFAPSSAEQPIGQYSKQMKSPAATKINSRSRFINNRPTGNLTPLNSNVHGGFLIALPPSDLYYSCRPHSFSVFDNSYLPLQIPNQRRQGHPPLLPLPISSRRCQSLLPPPPRNHGTMTSTATDHTGKAKPPREQSLLITKKSKQQQPKRYKQILNAAQSVVAPGRSEPNDRPKDLSKVLSLPSSNASDNSLGGVNLDLEKFSGSVFTVSPPPSSLPFPKFFVRPKLGCTAEAAGVDAGATDNLRRLLRPP